MTNRDNSLAAVDGKEYDHVPDFGTDVQMTALNAIDSTDFPFITGGKDMFGVPWIITKEGAIVDPGFSLFDEAEDWKKYVHFPDLDSVDFQAMADKEMADFDRNSKATNVFAIYGVFLRLISLMGFENGLMAVAEDPESCAEFFDACSDYQVDLVNRICRAYHPDLITIGEDMATARSLFVSPKVYRELIKPYHKKVFDAIAANGARPVMHTCGYCTDILDDYVEIGVKVWNSAQPCNDISALLDKYKGKLAIEGGWDTQGPCSQIGAPQEELVAEMRRCMMEYGKKPGFILEITLMNEKGNSLLVGDDRLPAIMEEYRRCNKELFGYEA